MISWPAFELRGLRPTVLYMSSFPSGNGIGKPTLDHGHLPLKIRTVNSHQAFNRSITTTNTRSSANSTNGMGLASVLSAPLDLAGGVGCAAMSQEPGPGIPLILLGGETRDRTGQGRWIADPS